MRVGWVYFFVVTYPVSVTGGSSDSQHVYNSIGHDTRDTPLPPPAAQRGLEPPSRDHLHVT